MAPGRWHRWSWAGSLMSGRRAAGILFLCPGLGTWGISRSSTSCLKLEKWTAIQWNMPKRQTGINMGYFRCMLRSQHDQLDFGDRFEPIPACLFGFYHCYSLHRFIHPNVWLFHRRPFSLMCPHEIPFFDHFWLQFQDR